YSDLYNAAIVADAECNNWLRGAEVVRDLRTNAAISKASVLANGDSYKALFTKERWQEFKSEICFFTRPEILSRKKFSTLMTANGYNGSPLTTTVLRVITGAVSIQSLPLLASLDIVLLALAFVGLRRAFSREDALLTVAFFSLNNLDAFH